MVAQTRSGSSSKRPITRRRIAVSGASARSSSASSLSQTTSNSAVSCVPGRPRFSFESAQTVISSIPSGAHQSSSSSILSAPRRWPAPSSLQALAQRPAPVAVENHGQVPGCIRREHVTPQPARVERVGRTCEPQRHPATATADPSDPRRTRAQALARSRHRLRVRARDPTYPVDVRRRGEEGGDVSPSIDDHAEADRISRRSTLVRAGGLAAAAITAGSAPAGALASDQGRSAAAACVLSPEMTDGPYYLPGEKVRRNITRRPAGRAAGTALQRGRRRDLQGDQGRRGRHLARERRWQVLGRGGQRHRRPHLPAGHPAHRREGPGPLPERLPGLVPRPRRPHPCEGPPGRRRRAHGPGVLPRQLHRRRLPASALPRTRRA